MFYYKLLSMFYVDIKLICKYCKIRTSSLTFEFYVIIIIQRHHRHPHHHYYYYNCSLLLLLLLLLLKLSKQSPNIDFGCHNNVEEVILVNMLKL